MEHCCIRSGDTTVVRIGRVAQSGFRLFQFLAGLLGGILDAGRRADHGAVVLGQPRFQPGHLGGDALLGLEGRFDGRAIAFRRDQGVAVAEGKAMESLIAAGRPVTVELDFVDLLTGLHDLEIAEKRLLVGDGDKDGAHARIFLGLAGARRRSLPPLSRRAPWRCPIRVLICSNTLPRGPERSWPASGSCRWPRSCGSPRPRPRPCWE